VGGDGVKSFMCMWVVAVCMCRVCVHVLWTAPRRSFPCRCRFAQAPPSVPCAPPDPTSYPQVPTSWRVQAHTPSRPYKPYAPAPPSSSPSPAPLFPHPPSSRPRRPPLMTAGPRLGHVSHMCPPLSPSNPSNSSCPLRPLTRGAPRRHRLHRMPDRNLLRVPRCPSRPVSSISPTHLPRIPSHQHKLQVSHIQSRQCKPGTGPPVPRRAFDVMGIPIAVVCVTGARSTCRPRPSA
jgi:hypothetical protein